jgi:hypothetical protein
MPNILTSRSRHFIIALGFFSVLGSEAASLRRLSESNRQAIVDAIGDNSILLNNAPEGIKDICSDYDSLGTEARREVWSNLFESMAMAESGFKATLSYAENFDEAGKVRGRRGYNSSKRVYSAGLLQLSKMSARSHYAACRNRGGEDCGCQGATTELLKNAAFNLKCGVTIMENQANAWDIFKRTGRASSETSKQRFKIRGSKGLWTHWYWAVLNKSRGGYRDLKAHLNRLPSPCNKPRTVEAPISTTPPVATTPPATTTPPVTAPTETPSTETPVTEAPSNEAPVSESPSPSPEAPVADL